MDLLLDALPAITAAGAQLALIGSGDKPLESRFAAAAARHPRRVAAIIGYDESIAHLVQGGADALLVPSRFEPCGLTQLCALRYGAIPDRRARRRPRRHGHRRQRDGAGGGSRHRRPVRAGDARQSGARRSDAPPRCGATACRGGACSFAPWRPTSAGRDPRNATRRSIATSSAPRRAGLTHMASLSGSPAAPSRSASTLAAGRRECRRRVRARDRRSSFAASTRAADTELERIALPERTGDVFHGFIAGVGDGERYGLRAHGPYDPRARPSLQSREASRRSLRRARSTAGSPSIRPWSAAANDPASRDDTDSAPFVPKGIVDASRGARRAQSSASVPWATTIIYELHVRGFTRSASRRPGSAARHLRRPRPSRGARAPDASRRHDGRADADRRLDRRAPPGASRPRQLLGLQPGGAVRPRSEARAGRHRRGPQGRGRAARGRHRGHPRRRPQSHRRGRRARTDGVVARPRQRDVLPDASPTIRARYVDDTGCGNTLALDRPPALRLALDVLRYYAATTGVDGFRFDLATTLGRRADGFDPAAPLLQAIAQDPALRDLKLIAEPGTSGRAAIGSARFAPGWGEWNDRYRDAVRRFWRGDAGTRRRARDAPRRLGRRLRRAPATAVALDQLRRRARRLHARRPRLATRRSTTRRTARTTATAATSTIRGTTASKGRPTTRPSSPRGGATSATCSPRSCCRAARRCSRWATSSGRTQRGNNNGYAQDRRADVGRLVRGRRRRSSPSWRASSTCASVTPRCTRIAGSTASAGRAGGLPDVEWRRPDGRSDGGRRLEQSRASVARRRSFAPRAPASDRGDGVGHRVQCRQRSGSRCSGPNRATASRWRLCIDTALPTGLPDDSDSGRQRTTRRSRRVRWSSSRRSRRASPRRRSHGVAPRGARPARGGGGHRRGLVGCPGQAAHRQRRHETRAARGDGLSRRFHVRRARAPRRHRRTTRAATAQAPRRRRSRPSTACTTRRPSDASCRPIFAPARAASGSPRISMRSGATATRASAISRRSPRSARPPRAPAAASSAINPLHALFPGGPRAGEPLPPVRSPLSRSDLHRCRARPRSRGVGRGARACSREASQRIARACRERRTSITAPCVAIEGARAASVLRAFDRRADARSAARPNSSASSPPAASRCGGSRCSRRSPPSIRACHGKRGRTNCANPTRRRRGDFAQRHARRIRFALYLQWLADRQFDAAARAARASGLAFGFFRDLAVGAAPDGAEVWANPPRSRAAWRSARRPIPFPRAARTGTCRRRIPQALLASGWRRVPRVARRQHAPCRRAADRSRHGAHAALLDSGRRRRRPTARMSGIRWRLLLRVLATESARARCLVVGEDLGTVPEGFRERLAAADVLSYRVLWFEREGSSFVAPARYPAEGRGDRVDARPADDRRMVERRRHRREGHARPPRCGRRGGREARARATTKRALCEAIDAAGVADGAALVARRAARCHDHGGHPPLRRRGVVGARAAAGGRSRRETAALNLPGTDRERPNWRRKVRVGVDALWQTPSAARDCRFRGTQGAVRPTLTGSGGACREGGFPIMSDGLDLRPLGDSATATASSTFSTHTILSLSRASAGMSSRSRRLRAGSMHRRDARAQRGQHLLLDAADRQHEAAQADLAGHRDVVAHDPPGEERRERDEHRDARARAVLRRRARGHVDVDVRLLEHVRRDAELLRARLDERQRGLRAFLHHVAQLSGQDELAVARHARRFDEQDVAADRRPRETGRDARTRRLASRLRPRTCADRGWPRDHRDRSSRAAYLPSAMRTATLRNTLPISRSRLRTPASRV